MADERRDGAHRPGRSVRTAALVAAAVLLAGAGVNAAAAAPAAAPAPDTISTVAGGLGGPGVASRTSMWDPGVSYLSYNDGLVYLDRFAVQTIGATDALATVAGYGSTGPFAGDGGPATDASLNAQGTTLDHAGNLVVQDAGSDRIRVVAAATGTFYGQAMTEGDIYTVAGDGSATASGNGGPATAAGLSGQGGIGVDAVGNLVFADHGNNLIRVVAARTGTCYGQAMTAGHIYAIAGTGTEGFSGDGGPATAAELNAPQGLVLDAAGNVLFADSNNNRVRVVAGSTGTFYGRAMTRGDIYTIAGDGGLRFSGDGGPATEAGVEPADAALDADGNVLIADTGHSRIRVVAETTGTFYGQAMTRGDIYTIAGNGGKRLTEPGGLATASATGQPAAAVPDDAGNVVIAVAGLYPVLVVAGSTGTFYGQAMTAGHLYAIGGDGRFTSGFGGPVGSSVMYAPARLSADAAGDKLITDELANRVLMWAGRTGTFLGQAMTAGDVYSVAGRGVAGFSGDGGPATAAELDSPGGASMDAQGNLVIADTGNDRIRVVAGATGTFYGQAMTAGDVYTVAGGGTQTGNGLPALQAHILPGQAVPDAAGNLVFADSSFNQVRVVAGATGTFYGQAMTKGDVYTIAGTGGTGLTGDGGPATAARLSDPAALALDAAGNVLIADTGNSRIRVVAAATGTFYGRAMTRGDIYTIAGGGQKLGDSGLATQARLSAPEGVAVDGAGDVLISDTGHNRVRVVAARTGTFDGLHVTARHIYTIAGTGTGGFSGDGGPGTSAQLYEPWGVAVSSGNVLFADFTRIRRVTG